MTGSSTLNTTVNGHTTQIAALGGSSYPTTLYNSSSVSQLVAGTNTLTANGNCIATGFGNTSHTTRGLNELVTFGALLSMIDAVLPIGSIVLTNINSMPSTYGGYIRW